MKKKYEVLNPRGVPNTVHVVSVGDKAVFEGQVVKLDSKLVADLVERGFLKEVKRGQ